MPGTFSQILLHVVFSTKRRTASIKPVLQERLYDYIGGVVRAEKGTLYAIGGMPDHIHLLLRWRTDGTIADLMRTVKSRSSLWVHQTFPAFATFAWQEGYSVFSVSKSAEANVKAYIEKQADHHQKRDFREELLALLRAHGVSFDPQYVFD
jgi:REP element-mobilizing transposase RayT